MCAIYFFFYNDLEGKVSYIAVNLQNPKTTGDLIGKVEAAILERFPIAEFVEVYHSGKEQKYAYYRIYADNYVIYYVVVDDDPDDLIMEVRRFLYKGQNRLEML